MDHKKELVRLERIQSMLEAINEKLFCSTVDLIPVERYLLYQLSIKEMSSLNEEIFKLMPPRPRGRQKGPSKSTMKRYWEIYCAIPQKIEKYYDSCEQNFINNIYEELKSKYGYEDIDTVKEAIEWDMNKFIEFKKRYNQEIEKYDRGYMEGIYEELRVEFGYKDISSIKDAVKAIRSRKHYLEERNNRVEDLVHNEMTINQANKEEHRESSLRPTQKTLAKLDLLSKGEKAWREINSK